MAQEERQNRSALSWTAGWIYASARVRKVAATKKNTNAVQALIMKRQRIIQSMNEFSSQHVALIKSSQ